jgi:hypothetical protein
VSVLGGRENNMLATGGEATLIGGSGNSTTAQQTVIGGGEENSIEGTAARAVILGGKGNKIKGVASVILGGESNSISGESSVSLGSYIHIT